MQMKRMIFAAVFSLLMTACSRQGAPQNGLLIAVSIPPQAWFVSRIAGEKARSLILVDSGQNPHNYEPSPRQIQELSAAGAWILVGSEFEISLRPKVAALFPSLLLVDGTQGVQFRTLEEHDHDDDDDEEDEDDDDHEHSSGIDRHIWLGREPAKILAAHIRDTLCLLDKENSSFYREQYDILVRDIDDEFDRLRIVLSPLYGRSVFVYHPSFGYFLDEFGIRQEAVETGGKEPGPRELNRLIAKLKEERPAAIFVQTQFPVNAAKTVAAAAGAEVLDLDPLAQDWLENLRRMGQALQRAVP
jgi:zinc transport system substrate-binding protein